MTNQMYTRHRTMKGIPSDPVIRKFRKRIHQEDNDVFLIIAGPRGSTKSGSGITLGYLTDITQTGRTRFFLDKKYIPKELKLKPTERMPRVIYKPSELVDMLNNNKDYPMGTCILMDEAGVGADARDFASKKNKLLKRTFQTVRSLNWFLILTAVTIKDFDVGLERNAGFYIRTFGKTKIKYKGQEIPFGKTKFYEININPTTGKKYTPFFNYKNMGETQKRLSEFYYIRKPPSFIEEPYKRYKHLFQTKLYEQYAQELDNIENFYVDDKTEQLVDIINGKMEEILSNPGDYYDFRKKKFVKAAIQHIGNIKIKNSTKATEIMQLLNLKLSNGDINVSKD